MLRETEREWAQALGEGAYGQLIGHLERLLAVAESPDGSFADRSDPRP